MTPSNRTRIVRDEVPVPADAPIFWMYPIVGGIIAEGITVALIALIVAMTGHAAGSATDPVGQRIGALVAATVGSFLCYVMGWWAARRVGWRFELHGSLVGVSAALLTVLGIVFGPAGQAGYYVVAVIMKIVAGAAGGRMAAKMAA
jgi:hypothetical protein